MNKFLILIISLFVSMALMAEAEPLKKITVTQTNNTADFLLMGDWIQTDADANYLKKLKAYVGRKGFSGKEQSELEVIKDALRWVTEQWVHDGMNEPSRSFNALDILKNVHQKNVRYRCVEYGLVLTEVLQAFGFHARKLALRSNDVAYGGLGQGHVAMEVWVNDLNKWIFLDPQFGVFLSKENSETPLNYYEIFQEKKENRWDILKVNFVSHANPVMPKDPKEATAGYKDFLKDYFGFISIQNKKRVAQISLLMESQQLPLTFQGLTTESGLSTRDMNLIYPSMNRVALSLSYQNKDRPFMNMMKKLNIKSNDDYLKKMSRFAAKPNFNVAIRSNSRDKDEFFEYRFSEKGSWTKIKSKNLSWNAKSGVNRLEVRSVNSFKRPGPTTFIELSYL